MLAYEGRRLTISNPRVPAYRAGRRHGDAAARRARSLPTPWTQSVSASCGRAAGVSRSSPEASTARWSSALILAGRGKSRAKRRNGPVQRPAGSGRREPPVRNLTAELRGECAAGHEDGAHAGEDAQAVAAGRARVASFAEKDPLVDLLELGLEEAPLRFPSGGARFADSQPTLVVTALAAGQNRESSGDVPGEERITAGGTGRGEHGFGPLESVLTRTGAHFASAVVRGWYGRPSCAERRHGVPDPRPLGAGCGR
jgi:hypothetical protein